MTTFRVLKLKGLESFISLPFDVSKMQAPILCLEVFLESLILKVMLNVFQNVPGVYENNSLSPCIDSVYEYPSRK